MALHGPFQGALSFLTGVRFQSPAPRMETVAGDSALALDDLVRLADLALPGMSNTFTYFPSSPASPLKIRKKFPEENHPNGRSFVHINPYSGKILSIQDARTAPLPIRFNNSIYPTHIGNWGGRIGRLLHFISGLVLPLLFITGLAAWWSGQRP